MKTPEFWRRITQVLPELLLDSSALGIKISSRKRKKRLFNSKVYVKILFFFVEIMILNV